jgi:spore coat polysaccharide biosynthesis protein SpsF (cytidylyltransferase family)
MGTAVIVQSRSGSTRLPGKAFLPLGGRAMTHTVLGALKFAREVDVFILAVPSRDVEAFAPVAGEHGFHIFGGSEEDVLGRYAGAAREYAPNCDTIVRATGDNPFVCPQLLDKIVDYHRRRKAPLSHYLGIPPGSGVEVISADVLAEAVISAKEPGEREHVTPWIYANRARFAVEEPDLALDPGIRLTVDTAEDLARAERILAALSMPASPSEAAGAEPITLERILALYRENPDIF